jgi:hypothetical protein
MPANEREKFLEWSVSLGIARRSATRLLEHLSDDDSYEPSEPNWICSPSYCLEVNDPARGGLGIEGKLIENGFIRIGSCPNGDDVLVNFRDPEFPVFYLSHELMDYENYTFDRKMIRKISDSISAYDEALSAGDSSLPLDFNG